MDELEVGDFVVVDTEGGKPGQVRYFDRAFGRLAVGIALVNEGPRVDEWHPDQVRKVTPAEAGRLALRFTKHGQ